VADLPESPDAAFVAVNRHATVEVVRALAARGAGGAVCYASGFAEIGVSGERLQSELLAAAAGMPLLGPNCHGLINYLDGVALWPEQHGGTRQARGVALVTQSGNIALNLTMQRRGLPIGYVVTLGNQARIALADAIEALVDDQRVTAIGLHIEGLGDPEGFMRAAEVARLRGVPLVALKSGRTALSGTLALSHTASLAGSDAVADAFLERAGVVRVNSLPVLLECLKVLHVHGALHGNHIASMSCSGGEAGLVADAAAAAHLHLRPFSAAQAQRVADTLPALASASNPLDYHNFSWDDEAALTDTYAAVMEAGFDLTLLLLDFPREDRCSQAGFARALRALTTASGRTAARAAVVATLPEALPEERAQELIAAGIVPLCGLEEALAATAAAARAGRLHPAPVIAASKHAQLAAAPTQVLPEWESKRALAAHGLAVPAGVKVKTLEAALAAASALGYPVVLKSVGPGIAHKSELGAVRLDLRDAAAVRAAAAEQLATHHAELLVEEMVTDGVAELIVGINRDPVIGLYLVMGSGGILVELVRDRRILLLPASAADIHEAIRSLRVGALVAGYRGRPAGDEEAAVAAVLAIQKLALAEERRLLELDVNPLIIRPHGHGAVAADALIRLAGV